MKCFGYAECYYCKDTQGPWILKNQKFICEDCYEKMKGEKHENKRNTNTGRNE